MIRRQFLQNLGATLMGWFSNAQADTASGIHVHTEPNYAPEFERIYTARLDSRASIKIRMHIFLGDMMKHGELTQPNGRWILFDPDAIADKILDPLLVPVIQHYVDEIFALDKEWRGSVTEYTDRSGTKWRRVLNT